MMFSVFLLQDAPNQGPDPILFVALIALAAGAYWFYRRSQKTKRIPDHVINVTYNLLPGEQEIQAISGYPNRSKDIGSLRLTSQRVIMIVVKNETQLVSYRKDIFLPDIVSVVSTLGSSVNTTKVTITSIDSAELTLLLSKERAQDLAENIRQRVGVLKSGIAI